MPVEAESTRTREIPCWRRTFVSVFVAALLVVSCGTSANEGEASSATETEPSAVNSANEDQSDEPVAEEEEQPEASADESAQAEENAEEEDPPDDSDGQEEADGDNETANDAEGDDPDPPEVSGLDGELLTTAADGTPEIGTVVESGSTVPADTYVLNVLGEAWRLDVTDETLRFGGSDLATFGFGSEALAGRPHFVGLLKTVGIVPPREVGIHQEHDPIVPEVTVDIPADLTTWLDAVPQIAVVDTGTSTVAGSPATWYRLTVDPAAGQTFHCPFGDHCAGFVVHPSFGVTVLAPELDVTVWQLDALPSIMPWVQVEDAADAPVAKSAMEAVLAGLRPA